MNKQFQSIMLLVLCIFALTGCMSSKDSTTSKEEVETPKHTPFTGEVDRQEDMRPIIVTINNDPKARPQTGLSDADMVFEFLVEGNMTRYAALYQSTLPENIGPVRSARDVFVDLAKGLDAFYIAHGYSPTAKKRLQANEVDNINGMQHDGTLFERSTDRFAPHNSYISDTHVMDAAELVDAKMNIEQYPTILFHEQVEDVKLVSKATHLSVQNGSHPQFTSTYVYDENEGVYTQAINDVPSIDQNHQDEIQVSNVFVVEAVHEPLDDKGRQSIDIQSGGKGLLFQAGNVEEVEWKNEKGAIVPVQNGETMKLVPGKTWIHVIRDEPGLQDKVSYTP